MNTGDTGSTQSFNERTTDELESAFAALPIVGLNDPQVATPADVLHYLELLGQRLEDLVTEIEGMRSELALWKIRKQVVRDLVGELIGVSTKAGAPE